MRSRVQGEHSPRNSRRLSLKITASLPWSVRKPKLKEATDIHKLPADTRGKHPRGSPESPGLRMELADAPQSTKSLGRWGKPRALFRGRSRGRSSFREGLAATLSKWIVF